MATFNMKMDGRTVVDAYLQRVRHSGTQTVFHSKAGGVFQSMSWQDTRDYVLCLWDYFNQLHVTPSQAIGILSHSRPEWVIADLAIQARRCITVPIYPSNSVEDMSFIFQDSNLSLLVVENEALAEQAARALAHTKKTLPFIQLDAPAFKKHEPVMLWEELAQNKSKAQNHLRELERSVEAVRPEDTASYIYTSGTTGRPKGAIITHSNLIAELRSAGEELTLGPLDRTLTFLPFAHVLGRVESLFPILSGIQLGFAENVNTVSQNLVELPPTLLVSVPRIYEKIYAKIQSDVQARGGLALRLFNWALEVGKKAADAEAMHTSLSLSLRLQHKIAQKLVFQKISSKMGGRIRFTISGGAPLASDLCRFFHACGVRILEGYGLTETTAAITVNRPDDFRFGTVGKPLPGVEIQIAPDGEILVKGPQIFKGYHNNPQATQEVFDSTGWFRTGDIGTFEDGFLKITDRKKELIVTSGGKKVAPQKLENLLKTKPEISHSLILGDQQKYIAALITVNGPTLEQWASQHEGLRGLGLEELIQKPLVLELYGRLIDEVNAQCASFETIKKFYLLAKDFSIETGELTPSLKVKRSTCIKKFAGEIKQLFPEAPYL